MILIMISLNIYDPGGKRDAPSSIVVPTLVGLPSPMMAFYPPKKFFFFLTLLMTPLTFTTEPPLHSSSSPRSDR